MMNDNQDREWSIPCSPKTTYMSGIVFNLGHCVKWNIEHQHGWIPCVKSPKHKSLELQIEMSLDCVAVVLREWEWQRIFRLREADVLVQQEIVSNGKGCHQDLVQSEIQVFNVGGSRVATDSVEEQDGGAEKHSFVDKPHREVGSLVTKGSAMPEYHTSKVIKLSDSIVTERCCSISFVSLNSKTDVGTLNHVNIICSISNWCCNWLSESFVRFDELHNFCLLSWRRTIDNDRFDTRQDVSKHLGAVFIFKYLWNWWTTN